MKKTLTRLLTFIFLIVSFTSCKSSNIPSNMIDTHFNTRNGGYILIKRNGTLEFKGPDKLKPEMDEDYLKDKSRFEKTKLTKYKNARIGEKNDKKYLTADGFKYTLLIIDDFTIQDSDDKEVYINPKVLTKK